MSFELLQTVVLNRDLPDRGLCRGDLGVIVQIHQSDGLEVEFVCVTGRTEALVTLTTSDVRLAADDDLLAIRALDRTKRLS